MLLGFLAYWRIALFAVAVGAAGIGGYKYAANACDAKTLQAENERLRQTIKEKDDQVSASEKIRADDSERASTAENETRRLQGLIDATPINTAACLDAAALGRVRGVK